MNFDKLIRNYLSTWYAPVRYAWLCALVSPLAQTWEDMFVTYRADAIERARYNSQTIILQSILNKAFDTGNKTDIYIKNSDEFVTPTYLNNEAEGYEALWVFNYSEDKEPIYLFNEAEYNQAYDFRVYVPAVIYNSSYDQIRGIIEQYVFGGINYIILSY